MALGILASLISGLLPIAIIVGIVVAISAARRRNGEDVEPSEPGIGTVRRLFLYGIAFVALTFAASGLALLIGGALDAATRDLVIAASDTELAIALAFTVVGAPGWLIFAWLAQRSLDQDGVERRSDLRRLYIDGVRGVALTVVMINAVAAGRFLVGLEDFRGGPWGWALAWGAVWALHSQLAVSEPPATGTTRLFDRLYLYYAAVGGLWTMLGGAMAAVYAPLSLAYDELLRDTLVARDATEGLRAALVVVAVGAIVWAWHWLRQLVVRDAATTLWYVYVFLFGVTAAVAATVGPAATLLHLVLQWWFGEPLSRTAVEHFDAVPTAVGILAIGATSWAYHRAVLHEGAPQRAPWSEPERVYRYLVAAAGLFTLAAGMVTLLAVALDALAPQQASLLQDAGWWRNPLVLGVTLVIVGAPLWLRYWFRAQHEASERGEAERGSLPRRILVFGVFAIAALVVLIDLVIVLFQLFEGLLEGSLSAEFIHDTRWSIALVLVAGAFGGYYWLVLREDQAAAPAVEPGAVARPMRVREVIVVGGEPADELARALEGDGIRVRIWRRLDATGSASTLSPEEVGALRQRILDVDASRLLLVAGEGRFELVPYQPVER